MLTKILKNRFGIIAMETVLCGGLIICMGIFIGNDLLNQNKKVANESIVRINKSSKESQAISSHISTGDINDGTDEDKNKPLEDYLVDEQGVPILNNVNKNK